MEDTVLMQDVPSSSATIWTSASKWSRTMVGGSASVASPAIRSCQPQKQSIPKTRPSSQRDAAASDDRRAVSDRCRRRVAGACGRRHSADRLARETVEMTAVNYCTEIRGLMAEEHKPTDAAEARKQ